MAHWNARVEFLLSVIELLFLSLVVEALQGKMCQNSLPSRGGGHLEPRFQGKGSSLCQYVDTTRKAIDCATSLPLTRCKTIFQDSLRTEILRGEFKKFKDFSEGVGTLPKHVSAKFTKRPKVRYKIVKILATIS